MCWLQSNLRTRDSELRWKKDIEAPKVKAGASPASLDFGNKRLCMNIIIDHWPRKVLD